MLVAKCSLESIYFNHAALVVSMPKINLRAYFHYLYCDHDGKIEDLIVDCFAEEKYRKGLLDERDDISNIMKSLGDGAECKGCCGRIR